jgi:hypothetical protein
MEASRGALIALWRVESRSWGAAWRSWAKRRHWQVGELTAAMAGYMLDSFRSEAEASAERYGQ